MFKLFSHLHSELVVNIINKTAQFTVFSRSEQFNTYFKERFLNIFCDCNKHNHFFNKRRNLFVHMSIKKTQKDRKNY